MRYQLKFINSSEHIVRELNIDADDENAAINYACSQAILFASTVDLCDAERQVIRVTSTTARVYFGEAPDSPLPAEMPPDPDRGSGEMAQPIPRISDGPPSAGDPFYPYAALSD